MIISASRRTDIPAFYADWFMRRIREGCFYVRNAPLIQKSSSRYDRAVLKCNFTPDAIECIVFWTKNAAPLIPYLNELSDRGYSYYFQFTVTPYGSEVEPNIPPKEEIVETFINLSEMIGKEKVILRYDPIFISDKYTRSFHLKAFRRLLERLHKHTEKCKISFVDMYAKVTMNMAPLKPHDIDITMKYEIAQDLSSIAGEYGVTIESCAENLGLTHGKCIDDELIARIAGNKYQIPKDPTQRKLCGCVQSLDIGEYNTCLHGCKYCYANTTNNSSSGRAFKKPLPDTYKGFVREVELKPFPKEEK